jgi:xanthine dehydrogenase molybdenum-binding subunit
MIDGTEGTLRPPLLFSTASIEYPDTRGNEKEEMTNFPLPEAYDLPRQVHFMEVEVDTETGKVDVINLAHVNDVGKAISPEGVEVQQESGAFQGVGRCIAEDFYRDPLTGVRMNEDLIGYPVLTMNDCAFPKTAILENGLGYGVYGSSGIGESAVACTTFLISAAVYNAIGKWIDPTVTPDKVLKALGKA